jgi:DNA-binding MarR family transcriptional regulator
MNSQFTERNLVRLIRLVERHTSTSIGRILEQSGYAPLTARHLQVFENIDPLKGSSIVQLAQSAAISKQAMSKLVQESAAAGCLEVTPNPDDSRFVIAKLTTKGEQLRQTVLDNVVGFYDKLTESHVVSEAEIESMTDSLLKMLKHFDATPTFKAV